MENDPGKIQLLILNKEEQILYSTGLSISKFTDFQWREIFVNCPVTPGDTHYIYIDTRECLAAPNLLLTSNASFEHNSLSINGEAVALNPAVKYGYFIKPDLVDKIFSSIVYIIVLMFFYLLLKNTEMIYKTAFKFCKHIYESLGFYGSNISLLILELLLCTMVINLSGIDFSFGTKLILYLMSVFAIIKFKDKIKAVNKLFDNNAKKYGLLFTILYAGFAFVGQRIFIYPIDGSISPVKLFIFVVACIWLVPIICTVFTLAEQNLPKVFSDTKALSFGKFVTIHLIILIVPALITVYAFNPGICSLDTYDTLRTAHSVQGMLDWHSAFYCLILHYILKIWDSTYAILFVQYFFWVYVVLELLLFLRKKQIKDSLLILFSCLVGLNTANLLHITSIWKDIPYSISVLWLVIILAKLSVDTEFYKKKWYIYLEFIAAMAGTMLYRKNGIVTFIMVALMAIILLRKNIKVVGSIILATACVAFISGPVFNHYMVTSSGNFGMYNGLGHDILGVYYADGDVSGHTIKMITTMTDNNNGEFNYVPTYSRPPYYSDINTKYFIINYVDTFIRNPVYMTKAVIAREDCIWSIFPGEGSTLKVVNYHTTFSEWIGDETTDWQVPYPDRKYRSIYDTIASITEFTAKTQWINTLIWRSGIAALMGIISFIYLIVKKVDRSRFILIIPLVSQISGLLLSCGWSDFRYFWPINLMAVAIVFILPVLVQRNN